jgi:hypothetical protein
MREAAPCTIRARLITGVATGRRRGVRGGLRGLQELGAWTVYVDRATAGIGETRPAVVGIELLAPARVPKGLLPRMFETNAGVAERFTRLGRRCLRQCALTLNTVRDGAQDTFGVAAFTRYGRTTVDESWFVRQHEAGIVAQIVVRRGQGPDAPPARNARMIHVDHGDAVVVSPTGAGRIDNLAARAWSTPSRADPSGSSCADRCGSTGATPACRRGATTSGALSELRLTPTSTGENSRDTGKYEPMAHRTQSYPSEIAQRQMNRWALARARPLRFNKAPRPEQFGMQCRGAGPRLPKGEARVTHPIQRGT